MMSSQLREKAPITPNGHWRTPWATQTQGWRANGFVFVGGQISMDDEGNVVGVGDFEAQLKNVMSSIEAVLRDGGCTLSDVIKVNSFIAFNGADEDIWTFWEGTSHLRRSYFPEPPGPAWTGIPVPRLAHPDLLIEIEVLAVVPGADSGQ